MAENNDLKVIVGLDIPKSVVEIEGDLKIIEKALAHDDKGKLKIVGNLNLGKTIGNVNTQIKQLEKSVSTLKITPQLDIPKAELNTQVNEQIDSIKNSINFHDIALAVKKEMNLIKKAGVDVTKEIENQLVIISDNFGKEPKKVEGAFKEIERIFKNYSDLFSKTPANRNQEIANLSSFLKEGITIGKDANSKEANISKYWYDRIVKVFGDSEESARKAIRSVFGRIKVGVEGEVKAGMRRIDQIFKNYIDPVSGQEYENSADATFKAYYEARQEALSWNVPESKVEKDVIQGKLDSVNKLISSSLGLVDANNKVIQSNEQVAQSEREVTEAQKELDNAKKSANTDKSTDEDLKKLTRSTELLMKITKQYELIKYYQEQMRQSKPGTDEWEYYNNAWQEEAKRFEITKQVAQAEGLVTEEYKKQAAEAIKRVDEKYAQLKNAKNIVNNNGGNYLSNNQIQDIFASLNEAEKYFKNFNLGTVTSSLAKGQLQGLKDFVIELKSVTGEVEKFRYAVENIGDDQNPQLVYKLTDIKAANAGIQRLAEAQAKLEVKTEGVRAKYTRLLEEFKSSNSAIQSGLTQPIQKFEAVLGELGKTKSIEDVKNQFESLKTSAAEISKYLDTTNNSFNKTRNAINNYNQMNDIISRIETSYSNLVIKNDELGNSVSNLRSQYDALVKLEQEQGGYTKEWAAEYQKVNTALKEVRVNIEAAIRAESNSQNADRNSQYQIQQRYLDRIRENYIELNRLQNSLINAGQNETAEIQKQIKQVRSRISYATEQLKKRELFAQVEAQINDYQNEFDRRQSLRDSKATDRLTIQYTKMADEISRSVQELTKLQNISSINSSDKTISNLKVQIDSVITDFNNLYELLSNSNVDKKTFIALESQLRNVSERAKEVRNTFDTVKGSITEAAKAYSSIEHSMSRLDTISGTKIFKDFSSSEEVKQLQDRISQLKKEYQDTFNTLKQSDVDSVQFKDALRNLDALDSKMKELVADTKGARDALNNAKGTTAFEKQVASLTNSIKELQNVTSLTDNQRNALSSLLNRTDLAQDKATLEQISVELAKLKAEIKQTGTESKNFDQISKSVEKVITDLDAMGRSQIFNTHSNNAGVIEFQGKIKGLSDTAKQVKADLNALGDSKAIPPELKARVDNLTESFKKLEGSNKTLQANLRQNDGWSRTERQIQTLTARIKEYMAVNTKAAKKYSGQFDGLLSGLSQAEMNKDSESVRRLSADFQILRSNIKAAGDQGKTFGQMIVDNAKKFSMWFSLTSNIMRAWRTLKQMVTTVRELDTAMTALKRVTDETESSYANFLKSVQTRAVELHTTMTDLIDQITTWSKLGYGLNEAQNLAQVSMMYSKVGDVDNETAVKDLVATMKAYNMTAEESIRIVDMLDVLNNKYAVSAKDLGAGLSRVASAMAVSNTSLAKSLSLITGGAEITQDAENIATALKVINARIRGRFMPPYRETYMLCA